MTRWGKAGVRLDPRDRDRARNRVNLTRYERQVGEVKTRKLWEGGKVVPHRITSALDLRGLEGPEVDAACLATEPDVDRWETGDLYPSWEQLCALAALTHFPVGYFTTPMESDPIEAGSLVFHFPNVQRYTMPVTSFSREALSSAAEMGVLA